MLNLTESASKELDAYFDGKEKSTIRVFLTAGGCSGPRLALALDDANEEDKTFDQKGYTFCINGELLEAAQSVTIDSTPMGFVVESAVPLGSGESGCASCGGGCGH